MRAVVDAHNTLILGDDASGEPRKDVVALVRRLAEAGWTIYVWSHGGREQACAVVNAVGLQDVVPTTRCCEKPNHPYTPERVRQTLGFMPDLQVDDLESEAIPGVKFICVDSPELPPLTERLADEDYHVSSKARTKRIVRRGRQWCVLSETTGRNFGCYDTREEAERRLRQIERFSDSKDRAVTVRAKRRFVAALKYDPDQPRDEHGRWTSEGGGSSDTETATSLRSTSMMPTRSSARGTEELKRAFDFYKGDSIRHISESLSRQAAAKIENITAAARDLVKAAESNPELHNQLTNAARDDWWAVGYLRRAGLDPGIDFAVHIPEVGSATGRQFKDPVEAGARIIATQLQDAWAHSATDQSPESLALQSAIMERFGVSEPKGLIDASGMTHTADNVRISYGLPYGMSVDGVWKLAQELGRSPAVQAYVDSVYSRTQAYLAEHNITEVQAYRGMYFFDSPNSPPLPDDLNYAKLPGDGPVKETTALLNPLSSFSVSANVAYGFAGSGPGAVLIESNIPAERIFSMPLSGPGCLDEHELVVIGGTVTAGVHNVQEHWEPLKPKGKGLKYDPDQPRDEHGRWTSEGGGGEPSTDDAAGRDRAVSYDKVAGSAYESLIKTGGATINVVTGETPTKGIAIASGYTHEEVYQAKDVTKDTIKDYMTRHADDLARPGAHLGLWEDAGLVHFDVSEVVATREEAERLGMERGELAGFDLATGETVPFATGMDPEHPIQTASVDVAARAIAEGRYVNLLQERSVSTLLDKLAEQAQRAKEMGRVLDLEKVTIRGTNLFLNGNLGVPRVEMPQFIATADQVVPGSPLDKMIRDGTITPDEKNEVNITSMFLDHLRSDMGITSAVDVKVPAEVLRATQKELDGGKVGGMVRSIESGTMNPEALRSVIATQDDYVLDGHHQWAATVGAEIKAEETRGTREQLLINTTRIDAPITTVLREAQEWTVKMGIAPRAVGKARALWRRFVAVRPRLKDWDESEHPRDERGRFTDKGDDAEERPEEKPAGTGPHANEYGMSRGPVVGTDKNGNEVRLGDRVLVGDRYGTVQAVLSREDTPTVIVDGVVRKLEDTELDQRQSFNVKVGDTVVSEGYVGQLVHMDAGGNASVKLPNGEYLATVLQGMQAAGTWKTPEGWIAAGIHQSGYVLNEKGEYVPGPEVAREVYTAGPTDDKNAVGSDRIYGITYPVTMTADDPRVVEARNALAEMIDRNKVLEKDLGLTNAWNGQLNATAIMGRLAAATKDWNCSINIDLRVLQEASQTRGVQSTEADKFRDWYRLVMDHELAHGLSQSVSGNNWREDYSKNAVLEEGVVEGYVESRLQEELFGRDAIAYEERAPGGGVYSRLVSRLDTGVEYSTASDEHPMGKFFSDITVGDRVDFYRTLISTPLSARQEVLNQLTAPAGRVVELVGRGLKAEIGWRVSGERAAGSKANPKDTAESLRDAIFGATTPAEARQLLSRVSAFLTDHLDLELAFEAEALVMFATSDLPEHVVSAKKRRRYVAVKYDPDQPRDEHGRWTSEGGGSDEGGGKDAAEKIAAATTPDNYRETWRPTMTPEEGHAWAKAAGTQYDKTVVHITNFRAVDGIRGTGFHTDVSTTVAHERGAYFATDPTSARFYEYKGSQAVSAVVVVQNPLMLDMRDVRAESSTLFRGMALEAAGFSLENPERLVGALNRISNDPSIGNRASEYIESYRSIAESDDEFDREWAAPNLWGDVTSSPAVTTALLKDAGYDGVIITGGNPSRSDAAGAVGGNQLIVFDKEQAAVIGSEEIPGWPSGGQAEMDAIRAAFAKRLVRQKYDPDQPRDEHGRWTSEGGGSESQDSSGSTPERKPSEESMTVWRSGPVDGPRTWVTPDARAAQLYAEGSYNESGEPPRSYGLNLSDAVVVDGRSPEALADWVRSLPVWAGNENDEAEGRRWLEQLATGIENGSVASYDVPERLEMAGFDHNWLVDLPERLALRISDLAGEREHESWWVDTALLTPGGSENEASPGKRRFVAVRLKYDPDQPRDEHGRWTSEGGGGESGTDRQDGRGSLGPYRYEGVARAGTRRLMQEFYARSTAASALKSANVERIGSALARAAASNPELAEALRSQFGAHEKAWFIDIVDPYGYRNIQLSGDDVKDAALYWAAQFQNEWANSPSEGAAAALQAAADRLMGGTGGDWAHLNPNLNTIADAYVRAVYDQTQKWLSDRGITELVAQRGMAWDAPEKVPEVLRGLPSDGAERQVSIETRPLTSWSLNQDKAVNFAGTNPYGRTVLSATIPADRVFSLPMTGPGCLHEFEVVTLGGRDTVSAQDAFAADDTGVLEGLRNEDPPEWREKVRSAVSPKGRLVRQKYDPDQPRDEHGRWTSEGGGGESHSDTEERPGGLGPTSAQFTENGRAGSEKMQLDIANQPSNYQQKISNIAANADALVRQAEKDPALKSQLEAIALYIFPESVGGKVPPSDRLRIERSIEESERAGISSEADPVEGGARIVATRLQDSWANTASDNDPVSLAMQYVITERFGVSDQRLRELEESYNYPGKSSSDYPAAAADELRERYGLEPTGREANSSDLARELAASPAVRAYVDTVYGRTQEYLASRGITEVSLYRGLHLEESDLYGKYRDLNPDPAVSKPDFHEDKWDVATRTVDLNPLSSFSLSESTARLFASSSGSVIQATVPAERIFSWPGAGPGCRNENEVVVIGGKAQVGLLIGEVFGGQRLFGGQPKGHSEPGNVARRFIAVRLKEWDESEHPRDERGRFTDKGDEGGEEQKVPGPYVGVTAGLLDVSDRLMGDVRKAGAPAELKVANIERVSRSLLEAAKTNGALRESLERAGQFVRKAEEYSTNRPMIARAGITPETPLAEAGARMAAMYIQDSWAGSASDSNPTSLGLQLAVAERFGISTESVESFPKEAVQPRFGEFDREMLGLPPKDMETVSLNPLVLAREIAGSPIMQTYVDSVYKATQDYLSSRGISEVVAYRGMHFGGSGEPPLPPPEFDYTHLRLQDTSPGDHSVEASNATLNPLSSFSLSAHTAMSFAGFSDYGGHMVVIEAAIPAERIFSLPTTGPGCKQESELLVIGGPMVVGVAEQPGALDA